MKARKRGARTWRTSRRRDPRRALAELWPAARPGIEVELVRRAGAEPELWRLYAGERPGWFRVPWTL